MGYVYPETFVLKYLEKPKEAGGGEMVLAGCGAVHSQGVLTT